MTNRPAEQWIPADTLGDRLRRLRRSLGMSQTEFATVLEVTPQTLASYEAGNREPRSIVALAKRAEMAFNVPATWVLGLAESIPVPPPTPPGEAADGSIVPKHVGLVAA